MFTTLERKWTHVLCSFSRTISRSGLNKPSRANLTKSIRWVVIYAVVVTTQKLYKKNILTGH